MVTRGVDLGTSDLHDIREPVSRVGRAVTVIRR